MVDGVALDVGQGLQATSGDWYRVVQRLGAGGNAVTYLVIATSGPTMGVLFALKMFRRLSKPERREQFLQEIEFLESDDHPCIMRVFDKGVYLDKHPFVLAEYLPRTLADVIRSNAASFAEKVCYVLQLLSALCHLAGLERPVVHRDIKPVNIFVKGRSCVLGDFGLMKRVDQQGDEDREVVKASLGPGMPWRYRTPDQVDYLRGAAAVTPKSDVFQLGLVVAELFTGRNPQRPAKDFADPVRLKPLVAVPGVEAAQIANLISRMLTVNCDERDEAWRFFNPWQGIFDATVERSHALEGRVF